MAGKSKKEATKAPKEEVREEEVNAEAPEAPVEETQTEEQKEAPVKKSKAEDKGEAIDSIFREMSASILSGSTEAMNAQQGIIDRAKDKIKALI